MAEPSDILIAIITVPDDKLAVKMVNTIVNNRLAACVHTLPAGVSIYRWQGNVESAREITLIIKTSADRYAELQDEIVKLHPFDVPEILAFPVSHGLPAYLNWVVNETRP